MNWRHFPQDDRDPDGEQPMQDYYNRRSSRRAQSASAVGICIAVIGALVLLGLLFGN